MAELPGKTPRRPPSAMPNRRPPTSVPKVRPQAEMRPPADGDIEIPEESEVEGDQTEGEQAESDPVPAAARAPVAARASAARRAARAPTPAPKGIPTLYKVIGIVLLVAVLFFAFGLHPLSCALVLRELDSGSSATKCDWAAEKLVDLDKVYAFQAFKVRLTDANVVIRDAAAAGMALVAQKSTSLRLIAAEELATPFKDLDGPGKRRFAPFLLAAYGSTENKDSEENAKILALIARTLIPETKNPDVAVRIEVLHTLGKVSSPGVCNALIGVATNDTEANAKKAARDGIVATALPDAVGSLLQAMASPDKDLKAEATTAFKNVREIAASADLAPLINSPDENVRKEIVTALGKRGGDGKATLAITAALKDTSVEIRKLALKAVQKTNVAGPADVLLPLISDTDESVRIQCAETLGELRDDGSKKVLLDAFATNPQGKTLEALSIALGKRSKGKDLPVIGVLIDQMNKHPESIVGIREGLVKLTSSKSFPKRDAERLTWDAAKWNAWWENISTREKMQKEAVAKLEKAVSRRGEDKRVYAELSKMTNEALDVLEKCQEMCKPNDLEDVPDIEAIQSQYGKFKALFNKSQIIDEKTGR